ncbi:DnaD domain-containing protein [Listeria booriae]|uniref:DnaD domain-containing protein n=1 Tax=Listeria booriae TaxID=1552123 RepID=UPI0021AB967F|nr:DnaD domain protein [Listeria booriae]
MSREVFESDIWTDVAKFRLFFYIVGNAVFSEKGVQKGSVHVGRGQYLRSYRNLREDLTYYDKNAEKKYGLATITRKVDELVSEGRLEIKQTEHGTLFTVCNYALYQDLNNYKGEGRNSNGTATEQQRNNKKNVNNAKNDLNNIINSESAQQFFQIEFQRPIPSPTEADTIAYMVSDMGEHGQELVIAAMKLAVMKNQKRLSFVEGVLRNWRNAGVTTIEQARAHEQNFRDQQQRKPQYGQYRKSNGRKEVLPDWMDNPEVLPPQQEEPEQAKTKEELDRKVAEMKRKLKEARA